MTAEEPRANHALIILDHLCFSTSITQRGPVVTLTFPSTSDAYATYQAIAVSLELDCDEVTE